jgi:hypothetical protein
MHLEAWGKDGGKKRFVLCFVLALVLHHCDIYVFPVCDEVFFTFHVTVQML